MLIQWNGIAIHDIGDYSKNSNSNFSIAKNYFDGCLMLPMNTIITDDQVKFVIDSINQFYE